MMKLLPTILGLVLGVGSSETAPSMSMTVESEGLPEGREQTSERLSAALATDLAGRGVEVDDGSEIRLVVQLRPGPGREHDVVIRTELHDGERLLFGTEPEICMACSDEQLLEVLVAVMPDVVAALPKSEPVEAAAPPEPTVADDPVTAAEAEGRGSIGPNAVMLYSGAAIIVVGSIGVGVGSGLLVVDERVVSDPGAPMRERVNYKPAGIAVVSAGAALAVTGAVLLGLGISRSNRQASQRVAVAPWAGREGAGAFVIGRF